jgi:DNA-binding transcriptional MerR regulator
MKALTTGQVAKAVGVNIQTLRFYEREGILPTPRRARSGYRQYDEETVRVVSFIKRAQELGFTLKEAKALLKLRTPGPTQREAARAAAIAKIGDIETRMRDLSAIKDALSALVDACACGADDVACPIVEALEKKHRDKA